MRPGDFMKFNAHRLVIAALLILFANSPKAIAATIDVPLVGSLSGFGSGEPYRGQTFRALAGAATKLTVFVGQGTEPGGLNFRVLLTEIDTSNGIHPTKVLFESEIFNAPFSASRDLQSYSIALGGIALTEGQQYAWILDSFGIGGGGFRTASTGTANIFIADPYADGFSFGSVGPFPIGSTRTDHFAGNWFTRSSDLAFTLEFMTAPSQGLDGQSKLGSISTRGRILTADNAMIGGFIIEGSTNKRVLVRSRGPSMAGAPFFVPGVLANPFLRLFSGQTVIAQNDNWQDAPNCAGFVCEGAAAITATGLDPCTPNPGQTGAPPNCFLESAILITLPPGAYTGIVTGADGGTGVGIVEVFEADASPLAELSSISTRGFVQTGDNIMIGGVIIEASAPKTVLIRGRGPSMSGAPFNLGGTLGNPLLQLFSGQTVIAFSDNWRDLQQEEIVATGLDPCQPNPGQAVAPPGCDLESAVVLDLPAGAYTAWLSGVSGQTGIGLVEIFEVPEVVVPNVLGSFAGTATIALSACQNPINNGTNNFSAAVTVNNQNGSIINGTGTLSGPVAVNLNLSGTATAGGDTMGSFTFTQTGGSGNGTFVGSLTGNTLSINFSGQFFSGETCRVSGSFLGNR